MSIVSLTSDYGWKDPDAGALRGRLYTEMLRHQVAAPVVDISHDVMPRNHQEGGYILRGAYQDFPRGSVHILLVDCRPNPEYQILAAEINGHYFLLQDHGGLSLLFPNQQPRQCVLVDLKNRLDLHEPGAIMCAAAAHLIAGGQINTLGPPRQPSNELKSLMPTVHSVNEATVHVQYIDHFGQVVTNASDAWLQEWHKGTRLIAHVRHQRISKWDENLSTDFEAGELFLRMNDRGFLEIGIRWPGEHGVNSAANLLGLNLQDPITLRSES